MTKSEITIKFLFILLLFSFISCQDQSTQIRLKKPHNAAYQDQNFKNRYKLQIEQSEYPDADKEWYLFIETQPTENENYLGQPTSLKFIIDGKTEQNCTIDQQWDSCYLDKNKYDPKKNKVQFQIQCKEKCQFTILAYFDYTKTIQTNKQYILDFEKTAYTQVFKLQLQKISQQYDQIQIILEPVGWLRYPEPINLYANWDQKLPTQDQHDFKGMHIWNDGQAIFIDKKQIGSHKTMTILIEGPQRNVLSLIINTKKYKDIISLQPHLPYFGHLVVKQTRKYGFDINNEEKSHNIVINVFTGAVESLKFTDPNNKNKELPSVRTQGQHSKISYHFSKQYIKEHNLSKIEFEVTAKKNSTYVIQFWQSKRQITPLFTHMTKTSVMEQQQVDQYLIKVAETIESDKKQSSSKIQVDINNLNGDFKARFYSCKKLTSQIQRFGKSCHMSPQQLKNIDKSNDKFESIKPYNQQTSFGHHKYWFKADWKNLAQHDKGQQQIVMMMIVIVQNINNGQTAYEIVYKNKDRIHPLKQGQLFIDRAEIGQEKLYELAFNDPDIEQIKIHLTKISGNMKLLGLYNDPRQTQQNDYVSLENNILTFPIKQKKTVKAIYVKAKGIQDCLYTFMVQIIRKSESDHTKSNTTGYNQVIIYENQPYQFILEPQQHIILQIRATNQKFAMHFKSNLPVDICATQNLKQPPFNPNCEVHDKKILNIDDVIRLDQGRIANIGVTNRNQQKVNFKLQLSKDQALCQMAPLGHLMEKSIYNDGKDDDGDNYHCLTYYLNRPGEFQINARIDNGIYNNSGQILIKIGAQQIQMISPIYHISQEQLNILCQDQFKTSKMCKMQILIQNVVGTKVHVMAQYTDQITRLIDGFPHKTHARMYLNQPKAFYYRIINKKNTTIFLENKSGAYEIYGKIISVSDLQSILSKQKDRQTIPNAQNNHFKSSNPFYFLQQVIVVTKQDIEKYCKDTQCVLLIGVGITGQQEMIQNGKFIIQCTQQTRKLEAGVPVQGYLPNKAIDFFTYDNDLENGSIIVTISNQNLNCLNIYINQGTSRPTRSSNKESSKSSNTLVLEGSKKNIYSISLEANDHCPYTIQVSTSEDSLKMIKKGSFSDVNLDVGKTKFFLYQNLINETFKVMSMHKSGQVQISVKKTQASQIASQKDLDLIKGYAWKNKDSVRIDNVRSNNEFNPNYCFDCYYLIKVEAIRQTEASLIIPTPNVQIPLTSDSIMRDILQEDESTTYRIFTDSESTFQLHVLYGEVRIQIIDTDDYNKTKYNETFKQSKEPIYKSFRLKQNKDYEFLRYSRIKITGIKESYFSFGVITNQDPEKRGQMIKFGIPSYLFLDKNKQKCIGANVERYDDSFLFSFDTLKKSPDNIKISIKLNNTTKNFKRQVGINQIIMSSSQGNLQLGKYDICIKNTVQSCSVTVIQSSPVVYLPAQTPIYVKDQLNITFASTGKALIQINQCKGRMVSGIYSEFNKLKAQNSQIKQRRRRNNLVQFYFYGPIFANFRISRGSVRWLPYDSQKQIGTGYDNYDTGRLRIKLTQNSIQLIADPLKPTNNKFKNKFKRVQYIGFAAQQQEQINTAMNCIDGKYVSQRFMDKDFSSKEIKIDLNLEQLALKFKKQKYILVTIKAIAVEDSKNSEQHQYRFYYPYQQVTRSMIDGISDSQEWEQYDEDEQYQSGQILQIFLVIVGILALMTFVLICGLFCYRRLLKPYLRRRQRIDQTGTQLRYTDFTSNR